MAEIDGELQQLPERQMTLVRLMREARLLSEGYLALQKQLRTSEVSDALRQDAMRVVDAPVIAHPDDPYFPKPMVNFVLALILGAASAGAVIALRSALREPSPSGS
jgi:uncharacterized protein involved in exopolysaccharide biosynthesis